MIPFSDPDLGSALKLLFTYGTLLPPFRASTDLEPAVFTALKTCGQAHVEGKLYDLGPYPGAIRAAGFTLWGELYRLDLKARPDLLNELDRYEGHPTLFRREPVKVMCAGQTYTAWIYWYACSLELAKPINSGNYVTYRAKSL
jgi:gamma-glutamylcyclotransferase (GGCT)/AIG2-like uncharacterized protein YtfP